MKFSKTFGWLCFVLALGCGQGADRYAILHTSMGEMRVRLYGSTSRESEEFIQMAKAESGLTFFSVERDFIIKAGRPAHAQSIDLESDSARSARPLEGALPTRGTLAMIAPAGTTNAGHADEGSFFIVVAPILTEASLQNWEKRLGVSFHPDQRRQFLERGGLPALAGHCIVFGEVVEGMEVADRIAAVPRQANGHPLQDISLKIKLEE